MKSEFAALAEFVVSKGMTHAELISLIHQAVMEEYRRQFPKSPADAIVLVDETSGKIRMYSGEEDVTPPHFGETAERTARQVMISRLQEPEITATRVKPEGGGSWMKLVANLFFWGYNGYFLLFNLMAAAAIIRMILQRSLNSGSTSGYQLVFSTILLVIPILTGWWAVKQKMYNRSKELLKLFFLFEVPLAVACYLPLALMSTVTTFGMLIFGLLLLFPVIVYLYESKFEPGATGLKILLFGEQFVTMMAGYLVLLFSFFVPIIVGGAARSLLGSAFVYDPYSSYSGVFDVLVRSAPALLLLFIIFGLVLIPYLILMLLTRAVTKVRNSLAEKTSESQVNWLVVVYAVVILTISAIAGYQLGGEQLMDKLGKISTAATFEEKDSLAAKLIPQKDRLKALIKDMEGVYSRYPFRKKDAFLSNTYTDVFDLPEPAATMIQTTFLNLAYPFVNQQESRPSYELATNYQYLFGQSYYDNPLPTPATAKNVLVSYRKVNVTPAADNLYARIDIEEEYDNQTYQQQEVVYEFGLPRGAVMTDLKLGPDLEYTGIIAPKGAAQRTYEMQLQVRRDPALLEETGPNQFRLRVFPVPAKSDMTTLKGKRQKVKFSYVVPAEQSGYGLPEYTKTTNAYTSAQTIFSGATEKDKFVPFTGAVKPDLCLTKNGEEGTLRLSANRDRMKLLACGDDDQPAKMIKDKYIAIFYDVSAKNSGSDLKNQLKQILEKTPEFVTNNKIDLYKYNDVVSQKITLGADSASEINKIVYFGNSTGLGALKYFKDRYDLVLIVSGAKDGWTDVLPFSMPTTVYIVHGDTPPPYNMEFESKLLQTSGGSTKTVTEALRYYALAQAGQLDGGRAVYVLNRYMYGVYGINIDGGAAIKLLESTTPDASSLLNLGLLRTTLVWGVRSDVTGNLTYLDQLNEFAKKAKIVTPYSSLIALVNQQQLDQLEAQKQGYNRYEDQTITQQSQPWNQPIMMEGMPFGSSGRIFDVQQMNLTIPAIGVEKTAGISQVFSGSGLFILVSGGIFVVGFLVYLVQALKRSTTKKKK